MGVIIILILCVILFNVVLKNKKKLHTTAITRSYPLAFFPSKKEIITPIETPNEELGRSESYFLDYLWKYFPDHIFVDLGLPAGKNGKCYLPDFTYIDKKKKLYIDIEIDEPYSVSYKPTHYTGIDNNRNAFFLNANWLIIRFSEEQIAKQPKSCCKFIAEKVAEWTKDDKILSQFKDVSPLSIFTPCWTKAQSMQMINQKYRETYKHFIKDYIGDIPANKKRKKTNS